MKGLNRTFLPISFDITGKTILVLGGGRSALKRTCILQRFADRFTEVVREVCAAPRETFILI